MKMIKCDAFMRENNNRENEVDITDSVRQYLDENDSKTSGFYMPDGDFRDAMHELSEHTDKRRFNTSDIIVHVYTLGTVLEYVFKFWDVDGYVHFEKKYNN